MKDLAGGHEASFAEHLNRVRRLCAALAKLGVTPADRVGVLASNSHAYIELWQACLAGAGIINPLNTRLAPDEIATIMNDSGTEVLFVDATHASAIDEIRPRLTSLRTVVLIGEGDVPHDAAYENLLAESPNSELPPEPAPNAPAVLMYTGVTTGLPKGVAAIRDAPGPTGVETSCGVGRPSESRGRVRNPTPGV